MLKIVLTFLNFNITISLKALNIMINPIGQRVRRRYGCEGAFT